MYSRCVGESGGDEVWEWSSSDVRIRDDFAEASRSSRRDANCFTRSIRAASPSTN